MKKTLRQLVREELSRIKDQERFDVGGSVYRTRAYKMNESVWTKEQEKAVKKLDLEFEKFLKRRGLDRYSKDASDLWRTAGFADRMRNIFGKNVEIRDRELFGEAGKLSSGNDDPCWKGYEMVGTKMKNGKEVPNCVPKNEQLVESLESIDYNELKDFVRYMNDFYGRNGVYASGKPLSMGHIKKAINRVYQKNPRYEWGGGDSVDRELVRDELFNMGILDDSIYKNEAVFRKHRTLNEIKVGQFVNVVNNPYWVAKKSEKTVFRRKVKAIHGDLVFFTDGSNSEIKYIQEI